MANNDDVTDILSCDIFPELSHLLESKADHRQQQKTQSRLNIGCHQTEVMVCFM